MSTIRMARSGLNVAGAVRRHGDVVVVADEQCATMLIRAGHADPVVAEVEIVVVEPGIERAVVDQAPEVAARVSSRPMRTMHTRP